MANLKTLTTLPLPAKIGIAAVIFIVITAGFYVLVYQTLSEEITTATEERDKLQGQIVEAERREEQYVQLTKELAEREAIDNMNKRVLPERAEIAAFLQDLNRVAELCGLEMRLIEPRAERKQQLYVKLPVSLSMLGSYHQLARFFFQMSKVDRIASMEDIALKEPTSLNTGELLLKATTTATTYRRAAPKAAAKAAKAPANKDDKAGTEGKEGKAASKGGKDAGESQ